MSTLDRGNSGQVNIVLKPAGQRPSADQMVQILTRRLSGIPGLQVFIQNPPSIRIGGRGSKTQYQYTLQGHDVATLYASAQQLAAPIRQLPMLADVTSDLQNREPVVKVKIKPPRAAMVWGT